MHPHALDVFSRLDTARAALRAAVDQVPPALRQQRPGPDRWSAAEVIEHISIVERMFGGRVTEAILAARGTGFLATRAGDEVRAALQARFPSAAVHHRARIVHLAPAVPAPRIGTGPVLVVCAGTGDLPVAEEAAVTAAAFGNEVERLYDVGVDTRCALAIVGV